MASLPSLPSLGPIVLFPFGFDSASDAGPSTTGRDDAPEPKPTSGDSSMRAHASSDLGGGDAAVPEPVSVPEAVTSPESTDVPEVVSNEIVAPEQVVTTMVPTPEETFVNEAPVQGSTVEQIDTGQVTPPQPDVRQVSTVIVTVPTEVPGEQGDVAVDETPKLHRKATTITITVTEDNEHSPSRKASLPTSRAVLVAAESTDAQIEAPRASQMILGAGTSVVVTETAPSVEDVPLVQEAKVPKAARKTKKARYTKTTKVKRVRVMSLWRRIIAKILRKKAEQKVRSAQVDGAASPEVAIGNSIRPDLQRSGYRSEAVGDVSDMHTGAASRIGIDDFYSHDGAAQSDVKLTDAATSHQKPCAGFHCGS